MAYYNLCNWGYNYLVDYISNITKQKVIVLLYYTYNNVILALGYFSIDGLAKIHVLGRFQRGML